MASVFISYRRGDSAPQARALYQHLARAYGKRNVFIDIDTIPPGIEFDEAIRSRLGTTDVVVALIGPRWLSAVDHEGRRRLDDPADYVRLEIGTALQKNIPVIPVLVDGGVLPARDALPTELANVGARQALELSETHWRNDMGRLIGTVNAVASRRPMTPARELISPPAVIVLSICALLSQLVLMAFQDVAPVARFGGLTTSALLAAIPLVRPAERFYQRLISVALILTVLSEIPSALDVREAVPHLITYLFLPLLTSGCLIVAFGARGGWKLSPVLVPFGAYIVFILLVWDPGFSPIGWVRFAATFTTSYMAVQSWYQQGNPGASWAAFGGAALMGHTFLDDFGMRVVPLEQVARWTFAMSVRESLAGRTSREHPNSARWVLSGAVVFMAWLAVGRLSTRFLGWMLVSNRPILGALIVATLGWGAAAVLLISIFEVNRRGIPRFVMVSLGVVAAWATWAAVAGVVGNASELALDAAAACGVWALPFFAFFERRAHRPSLAPSRYERNRAWFGAALAAGWALVIGANLADSDDSLFTIAFWVLAVASPFFAWSLLRTSRD